MTATPAPEPRRHGVDGRRLLVAPAEPDQVTVNRLVRHIAADPVLCQWLRRHDAAVLDQAARMVFARHGEHPAATVRAIAGAYRRGEAPLW